MNKELVIVIDFGGQYNQLVARRVRECKIAAQTRKSESGAIPAFAAIASAARNPIPVISSASLYGFVFRISYILLPYSSKIRTAFES